MCGFTFRLLHALLLARDLLASSTLGEIRAHRALASHARLDVVIFREHVDEMLGIVGVGSVAAAERIVVPIAESGPVVKLTRRAGEQNMQQHSEPLT